jgi:threonine dehydrogenase-like Zn-dependent dehydrogenase
VLGHELFGEVAALGADQPALHAYSDVAVRLELGTRVVAEPLLPCGACQMCQRAMPNLCTRWSHLGVSRDGCWAELVAVPSGRLVPVPEDLDSRVAVLVEPLACALNFVDKAGVAAGGSLLVMGAGPAGLMTALAAKVAGAAPLLVSEPVAERRALARRFGADAVLDPAGDDLAVACAELTLSAGMDALIEVTGNPSAIAQAVQLSRPGSTLVLAGICAGSSTPVDTNSIVAKELTVRGGLASRWHFGRALRLAAAHRALLTAMISEERPWLEAGAALQVAHTDPTVCKILLRHD